MSTVVAVLDAVSNVVGLAVVLGAGSFCVLLLPSAWGGR